LISWASWDGSARVFHYPWSPAVHLCILWGEKEKIGKDIHFLYVKKNTLKDAERYTPEELSAHSAADPDRVL